MISFVCWGTFHNIKTSFNTDTIARNWGGFCCISVVNCIHLITYSLRRNIKTSLFINLNQVCCAFQVNAFCVLIWVQVYILTERGLISFILFIHFFSKKSFALYISSVSKTYKIFSANLMLEKFQQVFTLWTWIAKEKKIFFQECSICV